MSRYYNDCISMCLCGILVARHIPAEANSRYAYFHGCLCCDDPYRVYKVDRATGKVVSFLTTESL